MCRLCEDLIGVEKKLMNVLEAAFVERQERIRSLCASTSSDLASSSFALPAPSSQFGGGGGPAPVGQHLSPLLSVDDSGIETLAKWALGTLLVIQFLCNRFDMSPQQ
jgi:hypothetical protein